MKQMRKFGKKKATLLTTLKYIIGQQAHLSKSDFLKLHLTSTCTSNHQVRQSVQWLLHQNTEEQSHQARPRGRWSRQAPPRCRNPSPSPSVTR